MMSYVMTEQTKTRDDSDLRSKQTQLTRDLILGALCEVIGEQGLTDLAVQEVAERAGVSHRTVYRHFETRDAMLEALIPWMQEKVAATGGAEEPESPEEIVPAWQGKFAAMDAIGDTAIAVLKLDTARKLHSEVSRRSTVAMRAALAPVTGHLDQSLAEDVALFIRLLGSSRMWMALRDEGGMDAERAIRVAGWAAETLIRDLEQGGGPGTDHED